ncbi:hypothetical protein BH11ACT5_BH11ACT5_11280 [soil metagenome]
MTALRPALALLAVLALAGCATPASGGGDTGSGGGDAGTDGAAGTGLDCSSITDPDYKLFVDPRLTVEPQQDVYSLDAGNSINFTDTGAGDVYTTYAYQSYYIADGNAFPSDAAIFVGAEDTGTFSLDGPKAPGGIDGGPYPGFVEIEATSDAGSTIIARLCVAFATSE